MAAKPQRSSSKPEFLFEFASFIPLISFIIHSAVKIYPIPTKIVQNKALAERFVSSSICNPSPIKPKNSRSGKPKRNRVRLKAGRLGHGRGPSSESTGSKYHPLPNSESMEPTTPQEASACKATFFSDSAPLNFNGGAAASGHFGAGGFPSSIDVDCCVKMVYRPKGNSGCHQFRFNQLFVDLSCVKCICGKLIGIGACSIGSQFQPSNFSFLSMNNVMNSIGLLQEYPQACWWL